MPIYLINLFIVVLAVFLASRERSVVASRIYLAIALASMVLVAGLRDQYVGTDTGYYILDFSLVRTFNDAINRGSEDREFGLFILSWLTHFISDRYMAFLFTIALIAVGCYSRAILRYSKNTVISFFVFITMGFYTFFFNGARQGLACAIYALAIGPLLERNLKKYLAYVLAASLVHRSALVTLPVYFLFNKENTIKTRLLILLLGCAGAYFFHAMIDISSRFTDRFADYGGAGAAGGYYSVALVCALCLFFFVVRKPIQEYRDEYDLFLNLFSFGTIISVVPTLFGADPSGILRLNIYFSFSAVFLWPILFKNLKQPGLRAFFVIFFVSLHVVLYILSTERFSDLIPYTFNPDLPFMQ